MGAELFITHLQQILGPAIHHAAKTLGGHAYSYNLYGAAQLIENEIWKRTVTSGKHGFELGNVLQGNKLPYQGRNSTEAIKAQ